MIVKITAQPYSLPESHRPYVGQQGQIIDHYAKEGLFVYLIRFEGGVELEFIAGEFEYLDITDVF